MHIGLTKKEENYKKATRLALASFISNFPNLVLVTISALTAHSTVVWVDVLVSFNETFHALLVWLVTWEMSRENGDKFNFGMSRLEVFCSFICDLIVTIGMVGVSIGAVMSIITPQVSTSSVLLFCLLKCVNATYDGIALFRQNKILRENPSKLNETEKITYRNSLINDISVGALALICYLLRAYKFALYLSPAISICLALYFIVIYAKHMKGSINELVDVSLAIPRQDEIYDIVLSNRLLVKRIASVNCRRINNKTHIEVTLVFEENVTYEQMRSYLSEIQHRVEKLEPDCYVCIVIESTEKIETK